MNVGQTLTPLGNGRYSRLADLCPTRSVLALELRRAHGLTNENFSPLGQVTTHICKGPKPSKDELPPPPPDWRRPLIERVLDALRAAWRSKTKLPERELCERLNASITSKRVEKALRSLCHQGLAQREGSRRSAVYWPTTTESST